MDRRNFCGSVIAAGVAAATTSRDGLGVEQPGEPNPGESKLFTPLQLRGVTLRNRIAMSPMCQYSSEDGFATDWHLAHYGARAVGGVGLIIAEATGVTPEGRITPNCLGVWKDEHIPALRRVTDFVHSHGAAMGIQLAHAGVKASRHRPFHSNRNGFVPLAEGGWQPVGPTSTRYGRDGLDPQALTEGEIASITKSFAAAAKRSIVAGFSVIELHFAHGYLGHSFLSPLMNTRSDKYGGSFENRVRFLLETVRAVRQALPEETPLLVRLSGTDWVEGGWTIEDSVEASKLIKAEGVDLVDCSSGGATRNAQIPVGPGYQVQLAEQIRSDAEIATGAVGLITEASQAEKILAEGQADLIVMGRQLLREPYWAQKAWLDLKPDIDSPIAREYAWALRETRR